MAEEDSNLLNKAREKRNGKEKPKNYWGGDGVFGHLSMEYQNDIEIKTEYLRAFWKAQLEEVSQTELPRAQILPPKRIRRIVKEDEDVAKSKQRIAKEVVELFGKACELFISELTLAAWMNLPSSKKVIQLRDISTAVQAFHSYDFLHEFVPAPDPRTKRIRKRATTTAPEGAVAEPSNQPSDSPLASPSIEPDVSNHLTSDHITTPQHPVAQMQNPLPHAHLPLSPLSGPHIPSIAHFSFEPTTPTSPTAAHRI